MQFRVLNLLSSPCQHDKRSKAGFEESLRHMKKGASPTQNRHTRFKDEAEAEREDRDEKMAGGEEEERGGMVLPFVPPQLSMGGRYLDEGYEDSSDIMIGTGLKTTSQKMRMMEERKDEGGGLKSVVQPVVAPAVVEGPQPMEEGLGEREADEAEKEKLRRELEEAHGEFCGIAPTHVAESWGSTR